MYLRHRIILFFFIILFGIVPPINSQNLSFDKFGPEEGLNSFSIHSLTFDSRGHLWIGSEDNGLFSYNGESFISYSNEINHKRILALHEKESDQIIYLGVEKGFYKYDGRYFTFYDLKDDISNIRSIDGKVFLTSQNSIFTFSNKSIQAIEDPDQYLKDNPIHCIEVYMQKLFIGTKKGLLIYENDSLQYLEIRDFPKFNSQAISSLFSDSKNLFISTKYGDIFKYAQGQISHSYINKERETRYHYISQLSNNDLVLVSKERKMLLLSKSELIPKSKINDLLEKNENTKISCVLNVNNNQIWLGSKNNGLFKWAPKTYKSYKINYDHYSIVDENIFYSTGPLVHGIINGNKIENLFSISLEKDERITSLEFIDDNYCLAGTSNGRILLKDTQSKKENHFEDCRLSCSIFKIIKNSEGTPIIIGANGEINLLKNRKIEGPHCEDLYSYGVFEHSEIIDAVAGVEEDFWLASREGKILHYRQNKLIKIFDLSTINNDTRIKDLDVAESAELYILSGDGISSVISDKLSSIAVIEENHFNSISPINENEFLLGGRYGLSILKIDSEKIVQSRILEKDPLFKQIIPRGISKNNSKNSFNIASRKVTLTLNLEEYLTQLNNGIFHLNIENVSINQVDLDQSIYVDSLLPWNQLEEGYQFNSDVNTISFSYKAHSYHPSQKFQYRWKLEGEDKNWSAWSTKTRINYEGLGSGKYKFLVQARSGEKIIQKNSATFNIAPKWYMDGNMLITLLLSMITITLLIVLLIKRNKKKKLGYDLKKVEDLNEKILLEQKTRQLQMSPHFLSNAMQNAQGLILSDQKDRARSYINALSILARKVLEHSRKESIRLDEEISMIQNYLKLEKIAKNKSFDFQIEIADDITVENTFIPPLLLQPLIENAVKHGIKGRTEGGKIRVIFTKISAVKIKCIIKDNGSGITERLETSKMENESISTEVIHKRLEVLHGRPGNWLQFIPASDKFMGNESLIILPLKG